MTQLTQAKTELRKELRQRRRDLPPEIQQQASELVCQQLLASEVFYQSQHIALYLAQDGELSLALLIDKARELGKALYLPVISRQAMNFHNWPVGASLREGPLGIREPAATGAPVAVSVLDLVLVPLVGFDDSGMRLGMGGGYYDRCFDGATETAGRPRLLGVAHSLQECPGLPQEHWDQRLDGVVTEKSLKWL